LTNVHRFLCTLNVWPQISVLRYVPNADVNIYKPITYTLYQSLFKASSYVNKKRQVQAWVLHFLLLLHNHNQLFIVASHFGKMSFSDQLAKHTGDLTTWLNTRET